RHRTRLGLLEEEWGCDRIVRPHIRTRIGYQPDCAAERLPGCEHLILGARAEVAFCDVAEQFVERRGVAPAIPGPHFRNEIRFKAVAPALQGAVDAIFFERLVARVPLLRKGQIREGTELPTRPGIGFHVHASHSALLGHRDLALGHLCRAHFVDRVIPQKPRSPSRSKPLPFSKVISGIVFSGNWAVPYFLISTRSGRKSTLYSHGCTSM